MKKIGIIGGMSWESTLEYYRLLNEEIRNRKGGFHSASCIIESVDFQIIEKLQRSGNWVKLGEHMAIAAKNLQNAGAELIVLATNTMHLCSEDIKKAISIPFVHIAEATGAAIKNESIEKVLLLGTKFTMSTGFYKDYLLHNFNIETSIPSEEDQEIVHAIIYDELVHGQIKDVSRRKIEKIIGTYVSENIGGVILGCTELPLIIKNVPEKLKLFDTTKIHASYALEFALNNEASL